MSLSVILIIVALGVALYALVRSRGQSLDMWIWFLVLLAWLLGATRFISIT